MSVAGGASPERPLAAATRILDPLRADPTLIDVAKFVRAPGGLDLRGTDVEVLTRLQAVARPLRARPPSRSQSRVRDIPAAWWPRIKRALGGRAYLDVGCADGSITVAMAESLDLDRARTLACDVSDLVEPRLRGRLTFAKNSPTEIPFGDGAVGLVSMNMVAHHFAHPAAMFAEARRVAGRGALLLLREHDPPPAELARVAARFDIEHALWATVLGREQTPAEFVAEYNGPHGYAHYKPLDDWVRELEALGFALVGRTKPAPHGNFAATALFEIREKSDKTDPLFEIREKK